MLQMAWIFKYSHKMNQILKQIYAWNSSTEGLGFMKALFSCFEVFVNPSPLVVVFQTKIYFKGALEVVF